MKIQIKLLLGLGLICVGSIAWFALTPSGAPLATAHAGSPRQAGRPVLVRPSAPDPVAPAGQQTASENTGDDEPGALSQWQARHAALLAESGDPDKAASRLVAELDGKYHQWVRAKLAALEDLPPLDRYDRIEQMESGIQPVAEALLGHLGIPGSRNFHVLSHTFEALSAEAQYAEMSGTHEQRVAMLRLDREREKVHAELLAANTPGADVEEQVHTRIEPWYESQLGGIIHTDDRDAAN